MISDTSKKEDLQKRERKKVSKKERKHIITLEQHRTTRIVIVSCLHELGFNICKVN